MNDSATAKRLRKLFPIGSDVTTSVVHVSRSGMSRVILVMAYDKEQQRIVNVSHAVAKLTGDTYSGAYGGVKVDGAGMDMCFALTYELSTALYRGSRSKKIDGNPGYALNQNTI